jgi:CRISPR type IV-associated protein Csf2
MKKTVTIHAILTTLSPLHIASPESFRYEISDATGFGMVKNGSKGGIACSGIQRRRFAPSAVEGIEFGVPFIAANNIAGRLRRQGAKILLDAIKAKGQKITLQTYSAITCGAVTGKPDSRDLSYAEYLETSAHPFVGLFGGGPRMLRRRMRVFDALPVVESLRSGGFTIAHPNGFGKATSGGNLTNGAAFRRGDDVSALLDVDRMTDTVEDFEAQHQARQLLIFEDQKAKDAEEKGSRHSTKAWSAFEFVYPGVDFDFTIELVGVTDAQIGLFLLALDGLVKESIGGMSRNGLGRIQLNDVVIAEMKSENSSVTDTVFNNNSLVKSHADVAVYLDAWASASTEISAERLDAIMKPPVLDSEEEKLAKAAEKLVKAAAKKAEKPAKPV